MKADRTPKIICLLAAAVFLFSGCSALQENNRISDLPELEQNAQQDIDVYKRQVKDNGVGMSAEHLDKIFDRFYRVDKARARETGGTGLGLHLVQRIAHLHHGRVEVESRENAGSTFRLVIPLKQKTDGSEEG